MVEEEDPGFFFVGTGNTVFFFNFYAGFSVQESVPELPAWQGLATLF
jgi:hypothetical protein